MRQKLVMIKLPSEPTHLEGTRLWRWAIIRGWSWLVDHKLMLWRLHSLVMRLLYRGAVRIDIRIKDDATP
ncbi:hypothetical protein ES703_100144 [subsurface metagenome]